MPVYSAQALLRESVASSLGYSLSNRAEGSKNFSPFHSTREIWPGDETRESLRRQYSSWGSLQLSTTRWEWAKWLKPVGREKTLCHIFSVPTLCHTHARTHKLYLWQYKPRITVLCYFLHHAGLLCMCENLHHKKVNPITRMTPLNTSKVSP